MSQWQGRSRGSVFGYRFFMFCIRFLGLGFTYRFLDLVVFYYFLFAFGPKRKMKEFYRTVGIAEDQIANTVHRNFRQLGRALVDRYAFLIGKDEEIQFQFQGHEHLLDAERAGKGGILISAHLGNWALAGNMLRSTDLHVPVNVLMYEAEVERIREYTQRTTGGEKFKIIPVKQDLSHMVQMKRALDHGEFVCIHADRFLPGARTTTAKFFGREARFPAGPFEIAKRFDAPTLFVYNMSTDKFRYTLYCGPPQFGNETEPLLNAFVESLERMVREYPDQWFNYYDFFSAGNVGK